MGAYTSRPASCLQDVWRDEWEKTLTVARMRLEHDARSLAHPHQQQQQQQSQQQQSSQQLNQQHQHGLAASASSPSSSLGSTLLSTNGSAQGTAAASAAAATTTATAALSIASSPSTSGLTSNGSSGATASAASASAAAASAASNGTATAATAATAAAAPAPSPSSAGSVGTLRRTPTAGSVLPSAMASPGAMQTSPSSSANAAAAAAAAQVGTNGVSPSSTRPSSIGLPSSLSKPDLASLAAGSGLHGSAALSSSSGNLTTVGNSTPNPNPSGNSNSNGNGNSTLHNNHSNSTSGVMSTASKFGAVGGGFKSSSSSASSSSSSSSSSSAASAIPSQPNGPVAGSPVSTPTHRHSFVGKDARDREGAPSLSSSSSTSSLASIAGVTGPAAAPSGTGDFSDIIAACLGLPPGSTWADAAASAAAGGNAVINIDALESIANETTCNTRIVDTGLTPLHLLCRASFAALPPAAQQPSSWSVVQPPSAITTTTAQTASPAHATHSPVLTKKAAVGPTAASQGAASAGSGLTSSKSFGTLFARRPSVLSVPVPLSSASKQVEDLLSRGVKCLLARGARDTVLSRNGFAPIHLVCYSGDTVLLKAFVDAKANLAVKGFHDLSPLHVACILGHADVVRLLLAASVSINVADTNGFTPLHYACHGGFESIVEMLINRTGTDTNARTSNADTPLHLAAYMNHRKIVHLLLANTFAPADPNTRDKESHTPLHYACRRGFIPTMELLLEPIWKTDMHALNSYRDTPLHCACYHGRFELVKRYLQYAGERSIQMENIFSETPLHAACTSGASVELVKFLLMLDPSRVNYQGNDGHTALHSACWNGHLNVVTALLERGADVRLKTKDGATPMKWAYDKGYDELVDGLQRHFRDILNEKASVGHLNGIHNGNGSANGNGASSSNSGASSGLSSASGGGSNSFTSISFDAYTFFSMMPSASSSSSSSIDGDIEAYTIPSPLGKIRNVTREKAEILQLRELLSRDFQVEMHEIEFQEMIGAGSFGKVFKATYRNRLVAVKRLRGKTFRARSDIELFCREVSILCKLNHPNVVKFVGACVSEPSQFCIITEFVSGGSLYNVLHVQTTPLDLPTRVSIALDVAHGMNYLHTLPRPIIHRDLNSHNILLNDHFRAVVSDFGESRIVKSNYDLDNMTKQPGNLRWMAPEVFTQCTIYSGKADLFSYGLTLWEIIAGQLPFADLKPAAAAAEIAYHGRRPPIGFKFPKAISCLVRHLWRTEPDTRPTFAEVVQWLDAHRDRPNDVLPSHHLFEKLGQDDTTPEATDNHDPHSAQSPTSYAQGTVPVTAAAVEQRFANSTDTATLTASGSGSSTASNGSSSLSHSGSNGGSGSNHSMVPVVVNANGYVTNAPMPSRFVASMVQSGPFGASASAPPSSSSSPASHPGFVGALPVSAAFSSAHVPTRTVGSMSALASSAGIRVPMVSASPPSNIAAHYASLQTRQAPQVGQLAPTRVNGGMSSLANMPLLSSSSPASTSSPGAMPSGPASVFGPAVAAAQGTPKVFSYLQQQQQQTEVGAISAAHHHPATRPTTQPNVSFADLPLSAPSQTPASLDSASSSPSTAPTVKAAVRQMEKRLSTGAPATPAASSSSSSHPASTPK